MSLETQELALRRQRRRRFLGRRLAQRLPILPTLQHLDPSAYLTAILPDLIRDAVDPLTLTPAAYARNQRRTG